MLEQRYWREEMVRRGGKGRIEEVVVVKEESGRELRVKALVYCHGQRSRYQELGQTSPFVI
jgi:ribosomal protein S3AE